MIRRGGPVQCLDHTNLTVGHGDQTFVYKFVSEWISGLPLHDVRLSLLVRHRDGGHHVSSQVNTEDSDSSKRQGDISKNLKKEGRDLGNIVSKSVGDGFLQVVKDKTTCKFINNIMSLHMNDNNKIIKR